MRLILSISERTMIWLERAAKDLDRTQEDLAECAVEEAMLEWAKQTQQVELGMFPNGKED